MSDEKHEDEFVVARVPLRRRVHEAFKERARRAQRSLGREVSIVAERALQADECAERVAPEEKT